MDDDRNKLEQEEVACAIKEILLTKNLRDFESVARVLHEEYDTNSILVDEPYNKWRWLYKARLCEVWNVIAECYNLEKVSKDYAQRVYDKLEHRSMLRIKVGRWILLGLWVIIAIWALSSGTGGSRNTDIHGLLLDIE